MRWAFLWLLAAVFPFSALTAQEASKTEKPPEAGIFPLTLVLEEAERAAYSGGGRLADIWQPDWPLDLPPDAFKVHSGELSGVTITGEGCSIDLHFDETGRVVDFPLMLNGGIVQISIVYGDGGEIQKMTLVFPALNDSGGAGSNTGSGTSAGETTGATETWNLEFLEYSDSFPVLVRGSCGDKWYFIILAGGGDEASETWYDGIGNFVGAYSFSFTGIGEKRRIREVRNSGSQDNGSSDKESPDKESDIERYYDSRGFLTETSGPNGLYRVLYYLKDLPRYWERRPGLMNDAGKNDAAGAGNFSLQWDENGFLVRLSGDPADYRYEYTLDEKGNWVERREIRMIRRSGLLVPSPGVTFTRVLEYRDSE